MTERQHLQRHGIYERRYARQFNRALKEQILSYSNSQVKSDFMERVYISMYTDIMQSEGRFIWNALVVPETGRERIAKKDFTDVVAEMDADEPTDEKPDLWQQLILQYVSLYLQTRIIQVSRTTVNQIETQIPDFALLNDKEQQTALKAHARVQQLRANTIARTETTNAMSKAQTVALKSSGKNWEKIWRGITDDRTREAHLVEQIDAFWIPIDQFFTVGGEQLLYPGDTVNGNATAKNLVNCRCYLEYRLASGRVGFRPVNR